MAVLLPVFRRRHLKRAIPAELGWGAGLYGLAMTVNDK
jgi:hypothetical protein